MESRLKRLLRLRKRKGVKEWKKAEAIKYKSAAKIQAAIRSFFLRWDLHDWNEAAGVVQALARGFITRSRRRKLEFYTRQLQRIFRGAKVRCRLEFWSKVITRVQKVFRGTLTRLRLKQAKLAAEMVVHSKEAIRRILDRSKQLSQIGSWTQYEDCHTNSIWYYHEKTNETRWEAPAEYAGAFCCNYDDCFNPICKASFASESELRTHRLEMHHWICKACAWTNRMMDFPTCIMCDNVYTENAINLKEEIVRRQRARERRLTMEKLKEEVKRKKKLKAKRDMEAKERMRRKREAIKRRKKNTEKSAKSILPSIDGCNQDESLVLMKTRNVNKSNDSASKIQISSEEEKLEIFLEDASPVEIVEKLLELANEMRLIFPLPSGFTQKSFKDGGMYIGMMSDGRFEGAGELSYGNGNCYKGNWRAGMKNGFGVFNRVDGTFYEGNWRDNCREGRGKLESDTFVYDGYWKKGKMHGQGIYLHKMKKERYEGEWRHGKIEGKGTFYKIKGTYKGNFKDGKLHGVGLMTRKNGEQYRGEWDHGEISGKGFFKDEHGNNYVGKWLLEELSTSG